MKSIFFLLCLFGLRNASANPFGSGLLGSDLEQSKSSNDFFRFFHFEVTDEDRGRKEADEIEFAPSGSSFHRIVTLYVRVDSADRIIGLRLQIDRSFIADRQNGVFARDLAKSFLLAVAGPEALGSLPDEIQYRGNQRTILMRGEAPKLPAEVSPAFKAFAGEQPEAVLRFDGGRLVLRNVTEGEVPWLELRTAS